MAKLSLFLLTLLATSAAFAQEHQPAPGDAAARYHAYRTAVTEPVYGLAHVKSLISRLKPDSSDNVQLSEKAFGSLPLKEKFTYTMLHAEEMSQNCNEMPILVDEDKKIFAYPAAAFDDQAVWSERQKSFLHHNRSRVIQLLRSTIKQKGRVGVNLKKAIIELDAYELIPDLVSTYSRAQKDNDIISVLMVLMKDGKYRPFMASSTFAKLYGEKASYQSYDVANQANRKLMIGRAMGYYISRQG